MTAHNAEVAALLADLASHDERRLELAADALTDFLDGDHLDDHDYGVVSRALLQALGARHDKPTQEALGNALASAAATAFSARVASVDWDPLARALPLLDPSALVQALTALSFTGQPRYAACVTPFTEHPVQVVREAAKEALAELRS